GARSARGRGRRSARGATVVFRLGGHGRSSLAGMNPFGVYQTWPVEASVTGDSSWRSVWHRPSPVPHCPSIGEPLHTKLRGPARLHRMYDTGAASPKTRQTPTYCRPAL